MIRIPIFNVSFVTKPCGVFYYLNKGEKLPMHTHTEETKHSTTVLRGSIKVAGLDRELILKKGMFYNFSDKEQTHEFEALEDNTEFLNLQNDNN